MIVSIHRSLEICASHILPEHKGKCSKLHGHNYRVEVWLEGYSDQLDNAQGCKDEFLSLIRSQR